MKKFELDEFKQTVAVEQAVSLLVKNNRKPMNVIIKEFKGRGLFFEYANTVEFVHEDSIVSYELDESLLAKAGIAKLVNVEDAERVGSISAYFIERKYGFILEKHTGRTWYLAESAADETLVASLIKKNVSQHVVFEGRADLILTGNYPAARNVRIVPGSEEESLEGNSAVKREPNHIPNDNGLYAKAKKLEQQDKFQDAEATFRKVIDSKDRSYKSAIKDLSSLMNRLGRTEEAIELLDQHKAEFTGGNARVSINQLKRQYLERLKRYDEAVALIRVMLEGELPPATRLKFTSPRSLLFLCEQQATRCA